MSKVFLHFQYFDDCPNHHRMRDNLTLAIQGIEDKVHIVATAVEDEETAARVMFRGSPTLLINGEDIEGMPAPTKSSLSCRFYRNGVPSSEFIRKRIEEAYSKE